MVIRIFYIIIFWSGHSYLPIVVSQNLVWKMRFDANKISYIRHQDRKYQHEDQKNNSGLRYFHCDDNIGRSYAAEKNMEKN